MKYIILNRENLFISAQAALHILEIGWFKHRTRCVELPPRWGQTWLEDELIVLKLFPVCALIRQWARLYGPILPCSTNLYCDINILSCQKYKVVEKKSGENAEKWNACGKITKENCVGRLGRKSLLGKLSTQTTQKICKIFLEKWRVYQSMFVIMPIQPYMSLI